MDNHNIIVEMIIQYGALGLIGAIFIVSLRKMMDKMLDMNTQIFEYFMSSNEKTNESIKNSINSIVQINQKNNDNILNAKHEILKSNNDLMKELQRIQIDRSILNEALSEQITMREEINKILDHRLEDENK